MSKQFCPHCGYKTLERVVVTVDAEGNRIYRGRRKPLSTKGLRVIIIIFTFTNIIQNN